MRNVKAWKVSSHEELFMARYERLLGSVLHLAGNNPDLAEDLLHDAYIQLS
jgi:DNA-directed RNA polymerase specialized sigma24 family protein